MPDCRACGFRNPHGRQHCRSCGAPAWHPYPTDPTSDGARRLAIGASCVLLVLLVAGPLVDRVWPEGAASTGNVPDLISATLGAVLGSQLGALIFVALMLSLIANVIFLAVSVAPLVVAWSAWRQPRAAATVYAVCGVVALLVAGVVGLGLIWVLIVSGGPSSGVLIVSTTTGDVTQGAVGFARYLFYVSLDVVVLGCSLAWLLAAVRQRFELRTMQLALDERRPGRDW